MRRVLLGALVTAAFVIAACVGDEPIPSTGSPQDGGGADGATPPGSDSSTSDAPGDPGDDSGAPADASSDAGYDVRALPGLRLWLESSTGLTGSPGFESWNDSSGRLDAGVLVAVPNGVNPPAVVNNGINGRPVVRFFSANGNVKIDNHPDLHFGTGDFAIVVVGKVTGGEGFLWSLMKGTLPSTGTSLSPKGLCLTKAFRGGDKCTSNPVAPTPEPHVFVGRRNGAQMSFRVDGVVRGTYDLVETFDATESFQPAIIGQGLDLELSELIVILGPTPDERLVGLEQHLKAKYMP